MPKTNKANKIFLIIAIVVLIVVLAIAITVFMYFKDRKQLDTVEMVENIVLNDSIHNTTLSIPFPHYKNLSSGLIYIKSSEDLNQIVAIIKELYTQYTVTLYGSTLIKIYQHEKACFYIKRSAMFVHETYGMSFDTRNLQNFTLDESDFEKIVSILIPYEYFYAINSVYSIDFPFLVNVKYNTKLKLMPDSSIDSFYLFYSEYPLYKISYEDEAKTLLYLYDTVLSQSIWIFFGENFCQYSA